MTTRNITKQFEALRSKAKAHHEALDAASSFSVPKTQNGPKSLLPDGSIDSSAHPGDLGIDIGALGYTAPPKWVDIADSARADMDKIDTFRSQLENAYSQRLKVSFGDDAGEKTKEELIDNLTGQTTALIKTIEGKIKKIAFADEDLTPAVHGNDQQAKSKQPKELSQNEKNIRLNVMRNLGATLHTKTKAFKNQQRDYLARLQKQQHIGNDLFAEITTDTGRKNLDPSLSNGDLGLMLDMALEQGLSDEQQRELDEIQERADDREKEIIGLVQNINELAGLFSELNVLVIEQGTLLDRIDYNVEQAVVNIQQGRIQLEKAEEKSSANWILKVMIGLLGLIVLEIVLLAVKWKIMGR